jgi:predicted glycogen debranching enzyme
MSLAESSRIEFRLLLFFISKLPISRSAKQQKSLERLRVIGGERVIAFGRDICNDLAAAEKREWLVTNGIGGFASGTIAGTLTRRYHGLLLAALRPPTDRTLLVSKLDEAVLYADQKFKLYTNNWVGQQGDAGGHLNIEQFYLEGTTPVWQFALADALLEKRIWMPAGANTTYIQYKLVRAFEPLTLTAKAFFNYRHYHNETRSGDLSMTIEPVKKGLKIIAYEGAIPYYLLSNEATATAAQEWYYRYFLIREANRGFHAMEDNLMGGTFEAVIRPGEAVTFVASIDATPKKDGSAVYQKHWEAEQAIQEKAMSKLDDNPAIRQLVLTANQFVVKRPFKNNPGGRSIIAGYHWFVDWGRDTMIALDGLTLITGRAEIAAGILRTFAFYVSGGMLPNRFPDIDAEPEYNTVDAALWYFEAMRAYHAATGDNEFVRRLFSVLADIIAQHKQGTRYQIRVDPADGLLYAGEAGQQLTWMDAKIGDWVVTPRTGKPVEINALWYNALRTMEAFAVIAEENGKPYKQMADQVEENFGRFWNEAAGYCYDVIDSPEGDDARLRPNQLFAVSLPHSPLSPEQQKAVIDVCARRLLTSHGIRTLAPTEPGYVGSYGGNIQQRDSVYHQGTVWAWLMGPFVAAHLRVYNDLKQARAFLYPLLHHITSYGLGSIGEIFDGDPPFTPRGSISQAWSVAEVLRAWKLTEESEQ